MPWGACLGIVSLYGRLLTRGSLRRRSPWLPAVASHRPGWVARPSGRGGRCRWASASGAQPTGRACRKVGRDTPATRLERATPVGAVRRRARGGRPRASGETMEGVAAPRDPPYRMGPAGRVVAVPRPREGGGGTVRARRVSRGPCARWWRGLHPPPRPGVRGLGVAPLYGPRPARARGAPRGSAPRSRVQRLYAGLLLGRQRQVASGAGLLCVAPPLAPRGAVDRHSRRPRSDGDGSRPPTGGLSGDGAASERRLVALPPAGRLRPCHRSPHRGPRLREESAGAGVLLEHGGRHAATRGHRGPSPRRVAGALRSGSFPAHAPTRPCCVPRPDCPRVARGPDA